MPRNLGVYSYSYNNPISLNDPDGRIVWGAVVIGVAYGILKSSGTPARSSVTSEVGNRPTSTRDCVRNVGVGPQENMQFSEPSMEWMQRYPWPGNVRELRNVIERAVALCEGDAIGLEHLPVERMRDIDVSTESIDILSIPEAERKDRIVKALDSFAGNQTRTAGFLGISRKTLPPLLDRYGIARPRKR